jgi:hypothetical protein
MAVTGDTVATTAMPACRRPEGAGFASSPRVDHIVGAIAVVAIRAERHPRIEAAARRGLPL